jgi:hypothetical protein
MSDEAHMAGDTFPPQESGALVVDEAPLPEGDASLVPPVYLVECSPSHLALHSRWYAPFLTLAPVGAPSLTFLAGSCVFVWVVFRAPMNGPLAWQQAALALQPQTKWAGVVMLGLSALFMSAFVLVSWKLIKHCSAAGPIRFDRDTDQLRFGRSSTQQTRLLSAITALQLIPTTWLALLEQEASLEKGVPRPAPWPVRALQRAFRPRENWYSRWLDHLTQLWQAKRVVYQLNLVFAGGARLHLTNWKKRPAMQALAVRLAAFLNVPLTIPGTAEQVAAELSR